MNLKPRVYVAGPFSGAETRNTQKAIRVAENVRALGFRVFVPHLFLLWDMMSPHEYEYWMQLDMEELECCDIMFKIADSPGANREEARALELRIPVVNTIGELIVMWERWGEAHKDSL